MRSLTTPLLPLITAAALTCTAAACGQATAPTGASPSTRPPTSSSAPATPTPTVTTPTVDDMYARAKAAVRGAESVRLTVTMKYGGDSFTVDQTGALDGSYSKRTVRTADGITWTTLWVESKVYLRANTAYWSLRASAADAGVLAGHWVRVTGDLADYAQPSMRKLVLDNLSDWAPGALRHEVCEVSTLVVGGVRRYQAMVGSDKNVFVVDADTWLPRRFTALDPEFGAQTVVLSGWDTIEPFTAPQVFAAVDMADR